MKKLIISLSITLIIFSTLYFLIQENIIEPTNARIKNLIGKSIENEYVGINDRLVLGFKRFAELTDKKLDYIIDKIELDSISARGNVRKAAIILEDYIESEPFCKRIRIVDKDYTILYSTAVNDVKGSKLSQDLYSEIFIEHESSMGNIIIDTVIENIIFYKSLGGDGKPEYRVLFYYSQDVLDSVFNQIESLTYVGFLVTTGKVLLVNFPEIDVGDEENLSNLVEILSEKEAGAVQISLQGFNKTVYYKKLADTYTDWTIGLTLDTERLRISKIGAFILIIQALVIVSIVIFVFISIKQKRGPVQLVVHPSEAIVMPQTEQEVPETEQVIPERPEGGISETPPETQETEVEEEVPTLESGVLSLSAIEEVKEVEEIGEAEVADEIEEATEVSGIEEEQTGEQETQELDEKLEPVEAEEMQELEKINTKEIEESRAYETEKVEELETEEVEELEAVIERQSDEVEEYGIEEVEELETVTEKLGGDVEGAETDESEEVEELEAIQEEELPEYEQITPETKFKSEDGEQTKKESLEEEERSFETIPTVEQIEQKTAGVKGVPFDFEAKDMADELQHVEELEEAEVESTQEIVESIEDDLGDVAGRPRGAEGTLPKLEKLIEVESEQLDYGQEEEAIINSEFQVEVPPTVPDEVYLEQEQIKRDDELSQLIDKIEQKEKLSPADNYKLKEIFADFITSLGNARGAILIEKKKGIYSPDVVIGLSDDTKKVLKISHSENIYRNILKKGKILHITEYAFFSEVISTKFEPSDSTEIDQLFIAPISMRGEIKGIVLVGVKVDESFKKGTTIEKLKKIKERIRSLI